jgi:hypothetical protein
LVVQVLPPDGSDAQELEELTALLRGELLDLDVAAADPMTAEHGPEDAKGALAEIGGWLAVHLGPATLRGVVSTLAAWAGRNNKTVEISFGDGDLLKLSGVTASQQEKIIDEWIARHASRS